MEYFVAVVLDAASVSARRPLVVAIDGRSSSGKTTLAARLQEVVDGATTVHTDDIAWGHSRCDWTGLLAEGILGPLRGRASVRFRPPAWDQRGWPGAIEVSADAGLVIVEGVGAGRRETAHLVDGIIWVQADVNVIARRNAARVAAGEADRDGVAKWMAEEFPFVADQRPWERAFSIVGGTSDLRHDPASEVVLGHPPKLDEPAWARENPQERSDASSALPSASAPDDQGHPSPRRHDCWIVVNASAWRRIPL